MDVEKTCEYILEKGILPMKRGIHHREKITKMDRSILIEMYTLIYKKCLEDKTKTKENAQRLYDFHNEQIEIFVQEWQVYMDEPCYDFLEVLKKMEEWILFKKHLNFMFRYLNKFFIYKFRSPDLDISSSECFHKYCLPRFYDMMNHCVTTFLLNDSIPFIQKMEHFHRVLNDYSILLLNQENFLEGMIHGCFEFFIQKRKQICDYIKCILNVQDEFLIFFSEIHQETLFKRVFYSKIKTDPFYQQYMDAYFDRDMELCHIEKLQLMENIDSKSFLDLLTKFMEKKFDFSEKILFEMEKLDNFLQNYFPLDVYRNRFVFILNESIKKKSKPFFQFYIQQLYDPSASYEKYIPWMDEKMELIDMIKKQWIHKIINNVFDEEKELKLLKKISPFLSSTLYFRISNILSDYKQSLINRRGYIYPSWQMNVFIFSNNLVCQNHPSITVPTSFQEAMDSFSSHYKNLFPLRKLFWDFEKSTLDIVYDGRHNLNMSCYHYILLDYLSRCKDQSCTFQSLKTQFPWEVTLLKGVLHSLIHHPIPILKKTGMQKGIDPEFDEFILQNELFYDSSKHACIKYILPISKTTNATDQKWIEDDLRFRLRSKIVHFLKKRGSAEIDEIRKEVSQISKNETSLVEALNFCCEKEFIEFREESKIFIYLP